MNFLLDSLYSGLTDGFGALFSIPAAGIADALSALISFLIQAIFGIPSAS